MKWQAEPGEVPGTEVPHDTGRADGESVYDQDRALIFAMFDYLSKSWKI